MEARKCCTRETCPAYLKTSGSKDEGSAPSEYTTFCDCISDTPRKRRRNRHFSMQDVYNNMESPEQFRATLSDMNIMTRNLLRCLKAAAGDCKLKHTLSEKSKWCLQNVCIKRGEKGETSKEVSLAQVTDIARRFLRSLEKRSPRLKTNNLLEGRNTHHSKVPYCYYCQNRSDDLAVGKALEFIVPVKVSLGHKEGTTKATIQFPCKALRSHKKSKRNKVDNRYCSCKESEREIDTFHSCESLHGSQSAQILELEKSEDQRKVGTPTAQSSELIKDLAQVADEVFYSCQSFSSEIYCQICHQSPCVCEVPAICKFCGKKAKMCKCARMRTTDILLAVQSASVCLLCKRVPGQCRCIKREDFYKDFSTSVHSAELLRSSGEAGRIKSDMHQKRYKRICITCGLKRDRCICYRPRAVKTCNACGKRIGKCVCEKTKSFGFGKRSEPQLQSPTTDVEPKSLELAPIVNFCKKCGIVCDRCVCQKQIKQKKDLNVSDASKEFAAHILDNNGKTCCCRKQGQINPDLIAELCGICKKPFNQPEKSMSVASKNEFTPEICTFDIEPVRKVCKICGKLLQQGACKKCEEIMLCSTMPFIADVCSCGKLLQYDLGSAQKICKGCLCEIDKCKCERPQTSKAPSAAALAKLCNTCALAGDICTCRKIPSTLKSFCKCGAATTDKCTCEQIRKVCCLCGEKTDICECGSTSPSDLQMSRTICQQCGLPQCLCKYEKAITAEKASEAAFEEKLSASTLEEIIPPPKPKKKKPTPECKGEIIDIGELISKVEAGSKGEVPTGTEVPSEGKMLMKYEMPKREYLPSKVELPSKGEITSKGEINAVDEMSAKSEIPSEALIPSKDEIPRKGEILRKGEIPRKGEKPSEVEIPSSYKGPIRDEPRSGAEISRRDEKPSEVEIPSSYKGPISDEPRRGADISRRDEKPGEGEIPSKIGKYPERRMRSLPQYPDICIWDVQPENKQELCECGRDHLSLENLQDLEQFLAYDKNRESLEASHGRCACNIPKMSIKPAPPPKPPRKTYRLAFPQHSDLEICRKCRFEPSPLIDQDGRVFCPGNCGCCLCPWRPRATPSMEDALKHSKFKVCKCRERGTIFTTFAKINSDCSQISYFDACPCREIAEAKHLKLYGFEMWDVNDVLLEKFRGNVVYLKDVKEVAPLKGSSDKFFSSALYNEEYKN